ASLRRLSDSGSLSGKTVTFKLDGTVLGMAVTRGSGAAIKYVLPASMAPGDHTVTVEFAGDGLYNASASTVVLVVLANTNTVVHAGAGTGRPGDTTTLWGNVFGGPNGASLKDETLTFTVDGAAAGS